MPPLVLARRLLARHPMARWVAVAGLAIVAAMTVSAQLRAVEAQRRSWGETIPVWVARSTIEPGTTLDAGRVRADRYPAAMVPPGAITELGGTAHQVIGAGEIVVESDVAPTAGPAALIPAGWAAVAVPMTELPVAPGDVVAVAAGGTVVPGLVVDHAAGTALVAVDERDLATVAAAVVAGDAILALSASPPPP
jgi:Flp pilus assembly protein CpaB